MTKKIILISGDPNSINSEIIYKCWKKLNKSSRNRIYLISNFDLMKQQFKKLKYKIKIQKVKNFNDKGKKNFLKIIDIKLKFKNPFNVKIRDASKYVLESLKQGHEFALLKDKVLGLINCPINKKLLKPGFVGVTEYLADKCKVKKNTEVMLIKNKKFAVSPITTHVEIKNVPKKITKLKILRKIRVIDDWYKINFKKKPSIGILGLNPHNAELKQKSEEKKIIIPAVNILKKQGIKITGPYAADTIFIDNFKKFDVIVGMYHDQVLSPFKTIAKYEAINLTLGLKYLRMSPDHGTATNLIGKKIANPLSLLSCINTLIKLG